MHGSRHLLALLAVAGALLALAGCGVEVDTGGDESDSDPAVGTYAGTTSQGLPIAFAVSPDGDVVDVVFAWRARCEDGQVYVNTIVLPGGPVHHGAFKT